MERDVLEHGEVVRGGFGAGAHLVVVEGDTHGPVQAVLDRPVGANRVGDAAWVGRQGAEVKPPFAGGFVAEGTLRFEHGEAAQALPLLRLSRHSNCSKT
jgi:hypothetical protein